LKLEISYPPIGILKDVGAVVLEELAPHDMTAFAEPDAGTSMPGDAFGGRVRCPSPGRIDILAPSPFHAA